MRNLGILTLTLLNFLLLAGPSHACQCDYQTERDQLIKNRDVILLKVTEATKNKVTAEVIKSYKNKVSKKVEILYPEEAECIDKPLSDLTVGKTYLVTTNRYSEPSDPAQPGYFSSRLCDLRKEKDDAKDLIKWLESPDFRKRSNERK